MPPPAESTTAPLGQGELYQPGQIVARVGDQIILYGDVAPMVNQILQPAFSKARNKFEREEIESYREQLTQQLVTQLIDTKLRYQEFRRAIEGKAKEKDKLKEAQKEIAGKVRSAFDGGLADMREKVQKAGPKEIEDLMRKDPVLPRLAVLMKENQAETMAELETILRSYGSSLEKQLTIFREHHLGMQAIRDKIKTSGEINHEDMLVYYRKNAEKYAIKAKSRFEILTVKFSSFPSKQAAWSQMASMGNAVYYGTPFEAVAKKYSQEPNAAKGGVYDWTDQGSLASDPIDKAIFTYAPGKLSPIIEDERGFHIVRVIERKEATTVPFTTAQKEIKEAIQQERRENNYREYVEYLRKSTPIWTIYDDKPGLAKKPTASKSR